MKRPSTTEAYAHFVGYVELWPNVVVRNCTGRWRNKLCLARQPGMGHGDLLSDTLCNYGRIKLANVVTQISYKQGMLRTRGTDYKLDMEWIVFSFNICTSDVVIANMGRH